MAYAGRQFVIKAAKPWSFSSPDDDVVRFEVRQGRSVSRALPVTDVQGVERAEMGEVYNAIRSTRISASSILS